MASGAGRVWAVAKRVERGEVVSYGVGWTMVVLSGGFLNGEHRNGGDVIMMRERGGWLSGGQRSGHPESRDPPDEWGRERRGLHGQLNNMYILPMNGREHGGGRNILG